MELKRRPQSTPQSEGGNAPAYEKADKQSTSTSTPSWIYYMLALFVAISIFTIPSPLRPVGPPTQQHVFYYGWLTAISTGLGVVPFCFLPEVPSYWIGVSNAVAAGMMLAASLLLFAEGFYHDEPLDNSNFSGFFRTTLGAVLGLIFILATKSILEQYEDLKFGVLGGADARKALLIFFVMTLHSVSEGVGIGVSFGGKTDLGVFISASLAAHNVPEGMAVAVVLLPRGMSIPAAILWTISTSLPQPVMAVPAYMFVHYFLPFLPVGLGFAGGAMVWVAVAELLMEAIEDTNIRTTVCVVIPSLIGMLILQAALDQETRSS